MNPSEATTDPQNRSHSRLLGATEVVALMALFFFYAGDPPPAVNEAHYLVKAKNFWDPSFCNQDLFASSGKAHTTFYLTFGWLTRFVTLDTTAWIGRCVGWLMIAIGLRSCCSALMLPVFASLAVAVMWLVGIEQGNLAGEWVIGGIEAKVPAYAFVLLGTAQMIRRRWSWVWIWFGSAAAFHVLTGGWAVVAGAIAFFVTERLLRTDSTRESFFSPGLFLGGTIALLGLVPALALTLGVTSHESAEAARIYSFVRIRHHLLPSDFPMWWFVRHGILVSALLLAIARSKRDEDIRRLLWFAFGSAVIALIGLTLGFFAEQAPQLTAKLLRYYWFRLTDAAVPLVLALWIAKVWWSTTTATEKSETRRRDTAISRLCVVVFLLAAVSFALSGVDRIRQGVPPSASHRLLGFGSESKGQTQAYSDWLKVCRWIRIATPKEEVFFTPRHQQSFKWYSHRAEVVNWKDVPQDATSLIEWERRFYDVYPSHLGRSRVTISYQRLRQYREEYKVRFMVVDNRITGNHLPLARLYPSGDQVNETYSVYELPYD